MKSIQMKSIMLAGLLLLSVVGCYKPATVSEQEYRRIADEAMQDTGKAFDSLVTACKGSNGFFASEKCLASLDDVIVAETKGERRLSAVPVGGELGRVNDELRGAFLCVAAAEKLVRSGVGKNLNYYTAGMELMKGACTEELTSALAHLQSGISSSPPESSQARANQ